MPFIRTRLSGVTGVYLIDMAGQVVNYWPEFTDAYLLEDGTMFGAKHLFKTGRATCFGSTPRAVRPITRITTFSGSTTRNSATTRFCVNVDLSHDEVIALGADPDAVDRYGTQMDAIVEVDQDGDGRFAESRVTV